MPRVVSRRIIAAVAVSAGALGASSPAQGAVDDVALTSRVGLGGAVGTTQSDTTKVSGNGAWVVFASTADNLLATDNNAVVNVYRKNLATGQIDLASRAPGLGGAAGNGNSAYPSISDDGRHVLFLSNAENLSGLDSETLPFKADTETYDLYVRDMQTGEVTLASRADGDSKGPTDCLLACAAFVSDLSGSGRYVAFSAAVPLTAGDTNNQNDIYVRDIVAKRTYLVSGSNADDGSYTPSISSDGRYVAFQSRAKNLSTLDGDSTSDVFLADRAADTVALVSRQSATDGGAAGDADSRTPAISADGRFVAFGSDAKNLATVDSDAYGDVFVRDVPAAATAWASGARGPFGITIGANGSSYDPAISDDGRYVAFSSDANNLSSADNDAFSNIFLRDRQGGTILASRAQGAAGAGGANNSGLPSVSANGRLVAFESVAANLVPGDTNSAKDTFVREAVAASAGPVAGDPPGSSAPDQPGTVAPPDRTPPSLTGVGVTRARFRVGAAPTAIGAARRAPAGTRLRLTLSEPASVTIRISSRLGDGLRDGGRCRPATRLRTARLLGRLRGAARAKRLRALRCVRLGRTLGTLRRSLAAGRRSVAFSGRIGRSALRAGRYVATVAAVDLAGNVSTSRQARFTIVR